MKFILMLCLPAVALWGYALNYVVFSYFGEAMFVDFHHVIIGVMTFFTMLTLAIMSVLILTMRRI